MLKEKKMYIDGSWTDSIKGEKIEIINPATEEFFSTVPKAKREDVKKAINAAEKAFSGWSRLTSIQRGRYLRQASENVAKKSREIAELMTKEEGKPLDEAEGEVMKGADILRYYAEEGERVYGRIIENEEKNIKSKVIYQPIGVAGAISPWNYPVELLAWKIAGALAAGCTVVAKLPSETPLSPLAFIGCIAQTDLPGGVLNAVTGSGSEIGPVITGSPKVKKIAFTGSTAVGKQVLRNCVDSFKKVSLELGGSLPMIVCEDSQMDKAVEGATYRSYRNMGQICIAVNRIYVHENIYEEFLKKFARKVKSLSIGNGLKGKPDLGPMCTEDGLEKTKEHINDALNKGAQLVYGGEKPKGEEFQKGYFFKPSILRDVNHDMLVMNEETFGPLVGVMPFKDLDEAIELANDTNYGLAAIGYTESLCKSKRLTKEIQAGNISLNNPSPGVINAPYGGWKDSGFGHEHGPEGLEEYLLTKHVREKYFD